MLKNVSRFISDGLDNGFRMPIMRSAASKKPSITLMFPYVTFILSIISLIGYYVQSVISGSSLLIPTTLTIMHFALCTIFYMIRSINKAKIDLDDGQIEISNLPHPEREENNRQGREKYPKRNDDRPIIVSDDE